MHLKNLSIGLPYFAAGLLIQPLQLLFCLGPRLFKACKFLFRLLNRMSFYQLVTFFQN